MIARIVVRSFGIASLVGGVALATFGCDDGRALPADADVCARATHLFSSCGVVLPTLANAPCTGAAKLAARCVVDHAEDCDALASIMQRLDECVSDEIDGGDLLPPATDLPVPFGDDPAPIDGGRSDGGEHASLRPNSPQVKT